MSKLIRLFLVALLMLSFRTAYADMVYRNREFGINFILPINEIKFPEDASRTRYFSFVNKEGKASDCKLDGLSLGTCVAKLRDENWSFALIETDEAGRALDDIYVKIEYSNDSTESSRNKGDTVSELRNESMVSRLLIEKYKVYWEKIDDYIKITAEKGNDYYTGFEIARLGRKVSLWGHSNTKSGIENYMHRIMRNLDFDATMGASEFDIKIVKF